MSDKPIASRVREIMKAAPSGTAFTGRALARALGLSSPRERETLRSALRDMRRRGEVERLPDGGYRRTGLKRDKPEIREVMWHFLRSRRQCGSPVTVADLVEVCGASAKYATEWLQMLTRRGVLKRVSEFGLPGAYRMVTDPVEMPEDEPKKARLKAVYDHKKRALAALDQAARAIIEARIAIASIAGDEKE